MLLCAVGVLAAACHDAGAPAGPGQDAEGAELATPPRAVRDLGPQAPDLALLAATIPEFGGLYFEGGVPTVYLTDVGQRSKADAALAALGTVRVLQGAYTYKQLDDWFQPVSRAALALPGVVVVDLDEAANRVFIGVEHATAAVAARAAAARLGLPAGAVVIEQVEPIHLAVGLRDGNQSATVGGLEIGFGNFVCTLGFNADRNGQRSFITNSHCTNTRGGSESTQYDQPFGGSHIGQEVDDPQYWRSYSWVGGLCPFMKRCRWSDAARAAYVEAAIATTAFAIAGTSGPNTCPPDALPGDACLVIARHFHVSGELHSVVAGQVLNKVGRTTGWTSGIVNRTCANAAVAGTDIVLLCQASVQARSNKGDSGSPVFMRTISSGAALAGILWGGPASGTEFWFSKITYIEHELGALRTEF
jgi:hypothetical protein